MRRYVQEVLVRPRTGVHQPEWNIRLPPGLHLDRFRSLVPFDAIQAADAAPWTTLRLDEVFNQVTAISIQAGHVHFLIPYNEWWYGHLHASPHAANALTNTEKLAVVLLSCSFSCLEIESLRSYMHVSNVPDFFLPDDTVRFEELAVELRRFGGNEVSVAFSLSDVSIHKVSHLRVVRLNSPGCYGSNAFSDAHL
jgi:hypothetical protein